MDNVFVKNNVFNNKLNKTLWLLQQPENCVLDVKTASIYHLQRIGSGKINQR